MNISKRINNIACTAFATLLLLGSNYSAAAQNTRDDKIPSITFYYKEEANGTPKYMCDMILQEGTYRFKRDPSDNVTYPDCISDEAYYFSVQNAPSGTRIFLTDERAGSDACPSKDVSPSNNFTFTFRVNKNDLTMETPLRLTDVEKYVGQAGGGRWVPIPEAPGLQLTDGYVTGQIHGKLSCAQFFMPIPA